MVEIKVAHLFGDTVCNGTETVNKENVCC